MIGPMRWRAVAIALVPACGSPGATPLDAATDAPPTDAPTFDVTGHASVRNAINDAAHVPTVIDVPYHSITASVKLADGSTPAVTIAADGTFSFPRAAVDQPYRLTLVTDGGAPVEYQLAAPHFELGGRVAGVIAYPSVPTLDGVRLDNDALTLALDRTRDHELAWSVAATGAVDYWVARVWAVVNVANATQLQLRRSWVVLGPHVTIDPSVFDANTTYIVETTAALSFLDAAAGDFRTVGFPASPYGFGSRLSTMFRVTN